MWVSGSGPCGADRSYLAGLAAGATGASPAEAQRRADDLLASVFDAREAAAARAERLRRGAAEASVYLSLSLLLGAFIACVSAAIGGRLRDQHP